MRNCLCRADWFARSFQPRYRSRSCLCAFLHVFFFTPLGEKKNTFSFVFILILSLSFVSSSFRSHSRLLSLLFFSSLSLSFPVLLFFLSASFFVCSCCAFFFFSIFFFLALFLSLTTSTSKMTPYRPSFNFLYLLRSTCRKIKTQKHYYNGYPGFNAQSRGCQSKNGLIQFRSDLAEAAASIQACTAAPTTGALVAKGYSCPGNSGSGLSFVGGTTIYGTVKGSPGSCSPGPPTVEFSVIRNTSFTTDTGTAPYFGQQPYKGTTYDAGMYSLCRDAFGCVDRPCP